MVKSQTTILAETIGSWDQLWRTWRSFSTLASGVAMRAFPLKPSSACWFDLFRLGSVVDVPLSKLWLQTTGRWSQHHWNGFLCRLQGIPVETTIPQPCFDHGSHGTDDADVLCFQVVRPTVMTQQLTLPGEATGEVSSLWGYPQIPSHHPFADGIFHYNSSIWEYPHLWNPPYI